MKLSLGFSPCPNDTFIFDALVHKKVNTEGIEFDVRLADVEALNRLAFEDALDITKLSYHAFAYLSDQYALLTAGSALGHNCGPLLIAKKPFPEEEIPEKRIAIPGQYTTANFLLRLAFPEARHIEELLFSEIEQAVLEEQMDIGLIIHENRFTYAEKGLVKLMDLGEFWESQTGLPIPLGGIVVNRRLSAELQAKVNRVLARSVAFAQENPRSSLEYVAAHAQEMEEAVMYQHISLYVNDYTTDLGPTGRQAIERLFGEARKKEVIPEMKEKLFVEF